ncbi:carboxylating nicotinate-nucleotide diphosphorylase [Hellea sp.]|jgi:nicotinate-nucleotide pyrophosphorylase (carboxylating)|nr:carboxylating nicotinate-nucleotide diphosphorylase [Hellea sp.]
MKNNLNIPPSIIEPIVRLALNEDFGNYGDITSSLLVPKSAKNKLYLRSRSDGIISGIQPAKMTYELIDSSVKFTTILKDSYSVKKGDIIAVIEGSALSLLAGERIALNFMGRLSGIATLTAKYVAIVKGTNTRIAATRKTTPGLRALEKQAVLAGGGFTHRGSLSSSIMIKDNHIAFSGGTENALNTLNKKADHMAHINVEVDTIDQLEVVLKYSPDVILLDNMSIEDLSHAVKIIKSYDGYSPKIEASGNINLSTVEEISKTGVDIISIGSLTHSPQNFDLGMDTN